jgi:glucose-1-phosphate cytidylyltransferase
MSNKNKLPKYRMKVVILAGGLGTRLSEETRIIPKPLVKIGKIPILIHIMNIYSRFSINDFIICCGYKSNLIHNYFQSLNHKIIDIKKNTKTYFIKKKNWRVQCVYTGLKTNTGGRLLKLKKILRDEKNFCLTYGDGLANLNITKVIKKHIKNKNICTMTAVQPPARYGTVLISGNIATSFKEKFDNTNAWINGGYFVFSNKIFQYLKKNSDSLEKNVLEKILKYEKITVYKHKKFWHAMDTLRDKIYLNKLWYGKKVGWKTN